MCAENAPVKGPLLSENVLDRPSRHPACRTDCVRSGDRDRDVCYFYDKGSARHVIDLTRACAAANNRDEQRRIRLRERPDQERLADH